MYTASMAERVLDYIPDKLAEADFFLDQMEDAGENSSPSVATSVRFFRLPVA
jgi:hypothetical protein